MASLWKVPIHVVKCAVLKQILLVLVGLGHCFLYIVLESHSYDLGSELIFVTSGTIICF